MKNLMCIVAVAVAATFAVVSTAPTDAFAAAKRSAYAAKETACKNKASHMKFGVHFVKRHRWIKECIARRGVTLERNVLSRRGNSAALFAL